MEEQIVKILIKIERNGIFLILITYRCTER